MVHVSAFREAQGAVSRGFLHLQQDLCAFQDQQDTLDRLFTLPVLGMH